MIYSNSLVTLHYKIATRRNLQGDGLRNGIIVRLYIWYYKVVQYNDILNCGYTCTGKNVFSGFIQTMQFVENLALKALII